MYIRTYIYINYTRVIVLLNTNLEKLNQKISLALSKTLVTSILRYQILSISLNADKYNSVERNSCLRL